MVIDREDKGGEKYLCAYIVAGCVEDMSAELKEYLAHTLPGYMIPSYFMELEKLPLTPNGKVDRRALPEPVVKAVETYIAPGDEVQERLAEIWSSVLGVGAGGIGIDDNFFHLGGHSLKAVSLSSQIHKALDVRVPLDVLFQTPTIRGLAQYIGHAAVSELDAAPAPVEEREYYPLSRNQQAFYILLPDFASNGTGKKRSHRQIKSPKMFCVCISICVISKSPNRGHIQPDCRH